MRISFSEAEWRQVKKSLAALDVYDVDGLRGLIEIRASIFATVDEIKLHTPKQNAKRLRKGVNALEQALAVIDPNKPGPFPFFPTAQQLDARIERKRALRAAIAQEIAEWRDSVAQEEAKGSSSKQNARTPLNEYWRILIEFWPQVTKAKYRYKNLQNFLLACSLPLLPHVKKNGRWLSEKELERQVSSFVRNLGRKNRVNETSKPTFVYTR